MNTSTPVLPSLVQCCARCSALLDDTKRITYPGTKTCATAAQGCRVCILLLRQVPYDGCTVDDADIDIVRRGAYIQKEATGVRLLRLYRGNRDTGPSLTPYLQARNGTDAYIQRSKPVSILEPHSTWPASSTNS
jgi:hypothetical protein